MVVVSAVDTGAQEFLDAVWPGGELWIDEEEAFKKALGGTAYRTWWLLKPSVLRRMLSVAKAHGTGTAYTTDPKTALLGGTFVVKGGEVVFVHHETSAFENGSARDILAAVTGTPVADLPSTPSQTEALSKLGTCSR